MKFGVNTFVLTSPFTNASTGLFKEFKSWGFEAVEIAVEDPAQIDPFFIKSELDKQGLACAAMCGVFPLERDLRGTPAQQQASLDYLTKLVDYAAATESHTVIGPMYSAVGHTELYPAAVKRAQWKTAARNLKKIARYAEQKNVILAMEPLNRWETDFINTCEQALQMIEDVGSPALRVHLDTFHMNIEEKDPVAAIRKAGKHLGHLHACGSDRGQPGNDHNDWAGIAAALKKIDYRRWIVIEAFSPEIKIIAKATSIWRPLEPSQKDLAVKGLRFLRQLFK
jgi:D-psicose/D-tagatose/L-ribulose 3-epimerase